MTPPGDGSFKLDSTQETFEATTPYQSEVRPPAPRLTQWAYSLVVEGKDPAVPFTLVLRDPVLDEQIASDRTTDGIASIEAALQDQVYELRVEAEQPLSFRAICTQTYGYHE